jgi:hypothetical protein
MKVTCHGSSSLSAIAMVTYGHTGREPGSAADALIAACARTETHEACRAHEAAQRFIQLLESVPRYQGNSKTVRGRIIGGPCS